MRNSFVRNFCGSLAAALVASACQSDTLLSGQLGAVVTVVDNGPALRSARVFVLPDTVVQIPQSDATFSPAAAHALVASTRAHFIALGWTELPDSRTSRPDVVVLMASSTQVETALVYPGWSAAWGYLPYLSPAADPNSVWGVPGGAIPYTYQVGTLVIAMLDVRAPPDTASRSRLLWVAGLDGAVNDPSVLTRALDGIDQAFTQSQYLRVK
jgi:hypothetical protein